MRLTISTQPISISRSPLAGSRPVVTVSSTISRSILVSTRCTRAHASSGLPWVFPWAFPRAFRWPSPGPNSAQTQGQTLRQTLRQTLGHALSRIGDAVGPCRAHIPGPDSLRPFLGRFLWGHAWDPYWPVLGPLLGAHSGGSVGQPF